MNLDIFLVEIELEIFGKLKMHFLVIRLRSRRMRSSFAGRFLQDHLLWMDRLISSEFSYKNPYNWFIRIKKRLCKLFLWLLIFSNLQNIFAFFHTSVHDYGDYILLPSPIHHQITKIAWNYKSYWLQKL